MRCAACNHENRPQAKFCAGCGAPLPRSCAQCGAELPAAARFCDSCGAAVGAPADTPAPPAPAPAPPGSYTPRHLAEKILTSRSAIEGERKLVTVLFADVAGFTALSTRLDPEDLHGVMDGCFQRIMESVHRFEGTVNQFTGDGVMSLFGAPIAHEDHAVRAVAAALEMQRALAVYAADLRRERGIEFGLRIGLNTGPVVVGKIGDDLRMDYTAQGETVNLAARLQAAGESGSVLISESTYRLANRHFATQERERLTLKGIAEPVRAFTVTGERPRRVRFDAAVERGLTPFVGRQRGLGFLEDCFERVQGGRGQVVSVAGDAGIGKSRLAYEFRLRLASIDCRYVRGGCVPHGEAAPFRLIVDMLRASLAVEEAEPESVQIEKLERGIDPALSWTLPYAKLLLALPAPELETQGLDQQQRKLRTLDAVKALVFRLAEGRPLVLLVEDLQWIDRSSLDVLRAIVDGLADRRLLLLCTYRTGYEPPWQDRTFHQRLGLAPLSGAEAAEMANNLMPASANRDLLVGRGEGNPFFLEELAAYLCPLDKADDDAVDVASRGVPDTIQDLLMARIDRLTEPLKRTLQCASVLGREFALRWLEAIHPIRAGGEVRDHVATLVAREMLHETQPHPEPRFAFTQSLIRDVAYGGLLMKSRAELHARAAAAIEAAYGERLDEVLPDLARHYALTNDHAKALHYAMRAGDRAAMLVAYDDAIESYRDALRLAEAHATLRFERAVILDRIGDAAFAQGEIESAVRSWAEALAASPERASRSFVADLRRKRAVAQWAAGRTDDALAELDLGLAALGGDRDDLVAARLYQELGRFHFRLGENELARRFAEQALALGERLGAPDVVSHAYNTLGVAQAHAGDLARGAATVGKSLETALANGLAALACRAYTNLAVLNVTLDHERSAAYCREGLKLARQIGDQLQQSWLHCAMAGGHCTLSGDYDEGVKGAEEAIELDRRLGQKSHLPIPIIILAQIYQCRGDYAQSRERYHEALALAEEIGEPQLLFPCYDGLATLAIEDGDEAAADEWLTRSKAVQEAAGWSSDSFFVLPFLC